MKVTAPSWRPDIHGAADLVEEVVRITGLDKVPSAPMPRLARRRPRRAHRGPAPRAPRPARARGPRAGRGRHVVVHLARHGPRVRRRPGCAGARQPDLDRDVLDAAEPAAGPARRGAAQPQPRLRRPRPVRGGTGLSRRRARGPVHRRLRRARGRRAAHGLRTPLVRRRPKRPASSMPRPTWWRCWPSSASTPPRRS